MQLDIADAGIAVSVSTSGAAILGATCRGVPFIRSYAGDAGHIDMTKVGSFPFVPFGGRVAGNSFEFEGRRYGLAANVRWDERYLHGDGWLHEWRVTGHGAAEIRLALDHPAVDGAPYAYRAEQHVEIIDGAVLLRLDVANTGQHPLPFGLGHHPFFPMTPETTLALDDGLPAPVPMGPVDRAGEWHSRARITWPERALALDIEADAAVRHHVLYVPDNSFDVAYVRDYFCFEPMTHALDGQHRPDLGGLQVLRPGEAMSATVILRPVPTG